MTRRKIVWSVLARGQLRRIAKHDAMRLLSALDLYSKSEQGDIKALKHPLKGNRLRVGEWRVLFTRTPHLEEIHIDKIGTRSDICR